MPKTFVVLKLKTAILTVVSVSLAVAVIVLSSNIGVGIKKGLILCANNVIPSLFLFTVVGLFVFQSGVGEVLGKVVSPVTKILFGLNGDMATAFLLSMVSGYPVGAKLVDALYQNGKITRAKALKMLTFSVNAGPSFIVTAVGFCVLKSADIGVRLLVAHLTATMVIAVVVRFLPDKIFGNGTQNSAEQSVPKLTVADAFVTAVSSASTTMLNICAFVVLFSGVGEILISSTQTNSPELLGFFEVTVGLSHCTAKQLPLAAFLLGFGGLSVIFQVMFSAKTVAPKFLFVAVSRAIHGVLSAVTIKIINYIFPLAVETGSFEISSAKLSNNSLPAAGAMLILCATVLSFWERNRKESSL